jgi:hypothetical protein
MCKKIILLALMTTMMSNSLMSQGYNIGIRAGLGQTKFSGPTEVNATEKNPLTGGFHFGINFQWNFNDFIGIRSEIVYNQNGSKYEFTSENGYYLYRGLIAGSTALDAKTREEWPLLRDKTIIKLDQTNAYLELPQTVNLRINDKWEVFAGGYIGLLLNPTAVGNITFGEGDLFENPYIFKQGLTFDYNSDQAGEFSRFLRPILLIVNDQDIDIPGATGAYYFFENDTEYQQKFKSIDYGLIGGFSYYLNKGFYTSFRVQYGLNDITRTGGDVSYQELNADKTFVFNNDFDRNVGFYLSLGFKF